MHDTPLRPLCGRDLERWRLENGLKKTVAADLFGLPWTKWDKLTDPAYADAPLTDPVVAMLLTVYRDHPEAAPLQESPEIKDFYTFLGFENTTQDREAFATLVGRSVPSIYRLLQNDGNPGRPLLRWIEAIKRLNLSPKQSIKLMTEIATRVSSRNKSRELENDNTEK
ncbi:hypothetical protein HMPREF3069_05190 [Achromobacter xylosoxidans]|uniref:hypothetical protein n=1 Tax=Achromobacter TaxID=222 RepID=UPI0008A382F9|nr:hypothetical protein [Achromobacter xylosoxidans]OFS61685.1 hypothetical protein HMPREF3069_05190 [Achromobacter xylosoxidans]